MNVEQSLNKVADSYRVQGYKVVVRPGRDDLPEFAKDFKVEIVARRDDGSVLASVKKDQSDLEADSNLAQEVDVTNQQRGWRFDLFVLGSENRSVPKKSDAKEPSEEDVRLALEEVEKMHQAGFVQQSFIAAWSALEASMRKRLRAEGQEAGWGTSPQTMLNELYSGGQLSGSEFRDLEGLLPARHAIVHGFTPATLEKDAAQFLVNTAKGLLEEPEQATTDA